MIKKKTDPLESWHTLQDHILKLNEDELRHLMARELEGKKRRVIVLRVHMRYNKLRSARERKELTKQTVTVRSGRA